MYPSDAHPRALHLGSALHNLYWFILGDKIIWSCFSAEVVKVIPEIKTFPGIDITYAWFHMFQLCQYSFIKNSGLDNANCHFMLRNSEILINLYSLRLVGEIRFYIHLLSSSADDCCSPYFDFRSETHFSDDILS